MYIILLGIRPGHQSWCLLCSAEASSVRMPRGSVRLLPAAVIGGATCMQGQTVSQETPLDLDKQSPET